MTRSMGLCSNNSRLKYVVVTFFKIATAKMRFDKFAKSDETSLQITLALGKHSVFS